MPRPSTPNMLQNNPRPVGLGPSSPPETPTSASPAAKLPGTQPGSQSRPTYAQILKNEKMADRMAGIHPLGNGTNFSYRPDSLRRAEQLSPRSSSSSEADESESESDCSDDSAAPRSVSSDNSNKQSSAQQPTHQRSQTLSPPPMTHVRTRITLESLIVEEVDFDAIEDVHCLVIQPYLIEYADSNRSRSRSRNPPPELDRKMVAEMRDLDLAFMPSDDDEEEDSDMDEAEYERLLLKLREERRRKRMSSGSISKRTISERGSDSDREDLLAGLPCEIGEPGCATRRIRRRINRHSLQFQDPPPPRIDELEEPDSSEEIFNDEAGLLLARELPFFAYNSMEVDSP